MLHSILHTAASALALAGAALQPPLASEAEVREAYSVFVDWVEAYHAGEYERQWSLTDYRIRRWHDEERWHGWMTAAAERSGPLLTYRVTEAGPVDAETLPCTEMRHCYRPGIRYVIFVIDSEYAIAGPQQPEYAVMAESHEGWRFGGGTFPNRPLGETAVILTHADERRFRPRIDMAQ